jgi:hypothetical protein
MRQARTRLVLDHQALNKLTGGVTLDTATRAAEITRRRVQNNIVSSGRVRTGRMLHSISTEVTEHSPETCVIAVGSDVSYTPYQNWGTRWIRGAHFYEQALTQLSVTDFTR